MTVRKAQKITYTLTFHTALVSAHPATQPKFHTQGSKNCNWGWWRNQPNINDQCFNRGANISTLDKQADTRYKGDVSQKITLSGVTVEKYDKD